MLTPAAFAITTFAVRSNGGGIHWSRWVTLVMFALTIFEVTVLAVFTAMGISEEGWAFVPNLLGF